MVYVNSETERADVSDSYTAQAEFYDRIYGFRPYSGEARTLRALVPRATAGRRWLDVGCGTGEHLRYLRQWYEVEGVEPNRAMRQIARAKLSDVPIHPGRMESFRLRGPFDAISCLFSAIGYLPTRAALNETIRNFARHLDPGGVILVEPWLFPTEYRPGRLPHVLRRDLPGAILLRMNSTERSGRRTRMVMHHLYGDRQGVRYFVTRHELTMFTRAEIEHAFHRAGLRVRLLRPGLTSGRGLFVGRFS
jgi:SAM-dependent methyltransferase